MAKYQVLQTFQDKYTEEVYQPDTIIELADDRVKEILNGLADYDGDFLTPVKEEEDTLVTEKTEKEVKPKTPKKGKAKAKTADSK